MWENPIFEITFAKAFRDDSDHFARLQRRIDSTQRNYRNTLHELERLQAEEAVQPEPAPASAATLANPQNQTPNPANGFVPQPAPDPPNAPLEGAPAAAPRPPANRPDAPRI